MDSVTQIALGAAVGSVLLGRKVGARATMWGAICGTVPDLDVFIPMGDAVADFTYHRSFSHSLFVLAVLTPLFVWLILKIHPQTRKFRFRWGITIYAVFATHVLLDSFTVYGTQIFWPLSEYPVSLGSVFIIDPAYTLPLMVGVVIALIFRHNTLGYRANMIGLILSSLYLAWGLGAQAHVQNLARTSLAEQGLDYQRLLAQPTPFNSILWRVVAVNKDHYHVGYYSLLDDSQQIDTVRFNSAHELLDGLESHWSVQRLQWFTHGFYTVESKEGAVVISDLRMGVEPDLAFRFKVAELGNPHSIPRPSTQMTQQRNWELLPSLWHRAWGASTSFHPGHE